MTKPRGKTKEIILSVADIQMLIGKAIGDIDTATQYDIRKHLEEAHAICINIRDLYEPIERN